MRLAYQSSGAGATSVISPGASSLSSRAVQGTKIALGSGGLLERFEGDLVAEALELVDDAALVALGVLGVAAVEEGLRRARGRAL